MLVGLGYKEIEVSFPSASETDFDFTRSLVETPGAVPDDVYLQVLSPCREDFIRRTVESMKGANKAILHLYLATSECFRKIVFGMSEEESIALAVKCTKLARSLTKDAPKDSPYAKTEWLYEFSPETFSDTSPEFVVRICEAVKAAWEPTEDAPMIFNLPATVEMATPNVYADQIEYFCTNVTERKKFCVSVHPHNDRGCAVAAAELAQMAGAERVEGTLFGNGERTGNVDLVTLALNLYTQGIWPNIDFSDINSVIRICEESTKIPVNERWPYGGQLVVCAFSGSHQDAIKKGFNARKAAGAKSSDPWQLPYLPLDPQDIGRNYEASRQHINLQTSICRHNCNRQRPAPHRWRRKWRHLLSSQCPPFSRHRSRRCRLQRTRHRWRPRRQSRYLYRMYRDGQPRAQSLGRRYP